MTLKTVTYEQVLAMEPCWLSTPAGRRRLKRYSDRLGGKATALDILRLSRIPAGDRLWVVLREDFIPVPILHEFACRCTERALAHIDHPDPRSIAAVEAKRKWLVGIITDEELTRVQAATWFAEWHATREAAYTAAWHAARVCAQDAAWHAALSAARDAAQTATNAAAQAAAYATERKAQMDMLIEMLLEAPK